MIRNHGYPVEIHIAVTDDGYILQLFRIRYGKLNHTNNFIGDRRKQPVILQHGLMGDSTVYLVNTKCSLGTNRFSSRATNSPQNLNLI